MRGTEGEGVSRGHGEFCTGMVKEDISEKVTSEWTWERAEGICHVNIWQKNILAGDPAKMKALQLHCDWNILAEVSVAGVE